MNHPSWSAFSWTLPRAITFGGSKGTQLVPDVLTRAPPLLLGPGHSTCLEPHPPPMLRHSLAPRARRSGSVEEPVHGPSGAGVPAGRHGGRLHFPVSWPPVQCRVVARAAGGLMTLMSPISEVRNCALERIASSCWKAPTCGGRVRTVEGREGRGDVARGSERSLETVARYVVYVAGIGRGGDLSQTSRSACALPPAGSRLPKACPKLPPRRI